MMTTAIMDKKTTVMPIFPRNTVIYDNYGEEDWGDLWDFNFRKKELVDYLYELNPYGRGFLVTGSMGRWDGYRTGFSVYDDLDELFSDFFKDCDYMRLYVDENGSLVIQGSHHDGTNVGRLLILSDKGQDILEEWEYDEGPFKNLSTQQLHKLLVEKYCRVLF